MTTPNQMPSPHKFNIAETEITAQFEALFQEENITLQSVIYEVKPTGRTLEIVGTPANVQRAWDILDAHAPELVMYGSEVYAPNFADALFIEDFA